MSPKVRMRGALMGAVVALTFALTWSLVKVPTLEDKADAAVTEVNTLKPQVEELTDNQEKLLLGLDEANRRLVALGKTPVPVPTVTPSQTPAGLSAAEVRLIVTQELADQNITVTQAEVTQISKALGTLQKQLPTQVKTAASLAVTAYCGEDRCVGKTGADGAEGKPGKDAPKISDEELLKTIQAALVSFCGQESKPCRGEDGTDGKDGKDAPPPYSVVDQDCIGDGDESYWRVYLSNGTEQKTLETAGPCRIGEDPN